MRIAVAVASAWLAACAPSPTPAPEEGAPADPTAFPAEPARRPGARPLGYGSLLLSHHFTQAPRYIEGSSAFAGLMLGGDLLRVEMFLTSTNCEDGAAYCQQVRWELPPGDYRVLTYEMVCNGNCGTLSSSQDACQGAVTIAAGQTTRASASVTPQGGCSLAVR